MSALLEALEQYARVTPRKIALCDETKVIRYRELQKLVTLLAERLSDTAPRVIALLADNSTTWALADLAAQAAGIPIVPLPPFFSAEQITHTIKSAGIELILTDQPQRLQTILNAAVIGLNRPSELSGEQFQITSFYDQLQTVRVPESLRNSNETPQTPNPNTDKITFTSGTTGAPKGVCLGYPAMVTVAESLRAASAATKKDIHLCLLPLAMLLENIGGLYTPLLAGATVCLPGLASVGLTGSSGLDIECMLAALHKWQATSAIMVPQMLQALVSKGLAGAAMPSTLRYLAVGGAPISLRLLRNAQSLRLPVFEGYGLSECASVVAVNRPGAHRPGSAGLPLPHIDIDFAADGEILIRDPASSGYLGDPLSADSTCFPTGDIGHMDADGFLYITGRKKNMFITSFGRNVAPEWVERELVSRPPILQAAIFGDGRPFNTAVIFASPTAKPAEIQTAIDEANQQLPDYARIQAWISAKTPFTALNGMTTPNGRLRRNHIEATFAEAITAIYLKPQSQITKNQQSLTTRNFQSLLTQESA